jgi:hypothetical protein
MKLASACLMLFLVGCDTLENRRDLYTSDGELNRLRTTSAMTTTQVETQATTATARSTTPPVHAARRSVAKPAPSPQPASEMGEESSLPPP